MTSIYALLPMVEFMQVTTPPPLIRHSCDKQERKSVFKCERCVRANGSLIICPFSNRFKRELDLADVVPPTISMYIIYTSIGLNRMYTDGGISPGHCFTSLGCFAIRDKSEKVNKNNSILVISYYVSSGYRCVCTYVRNSTVRCSQTSGRCDRNA